MLSLVHAPNSILAKKAKPITKIDTTIVRLIEQMKQTLLWAKDPEGVGLAAPQVGKSLQLFIVKQTPKAPVGVYINPELFSPTQRVSKRVTRKKSKTKKLEGCLSLPTIWGEVVRDPFITMSYTDEKGLQHKRTFRGFLATILQHEYDHIQGILFPKRVLEQHGMLYKSKKDKDGKDIFEEIQI